MSSLIDNTTFTRTTAHHSLLPRYCHGLVTHNPANSAFQTHPVVSESLISPIPDSITFEEAVVLPLAVSTASAGLYRKDILDLPLPSATKPEKTGKTVLVWGGASSVGVAAVQLAAASGARVISTASTHNHDLVKSVGADLVFDYKSPTVVDDIADALSKTDFVGVYDANGEDATVDAISAILDRLNKKVPVAGVPETGKKTDRFVPVRSRPWPLYKM
jgi:NADPH:quinone reductase-like Zn-dependent oxidoreductase